MNAKLIPVSFAWSLLLLATTAFFLFPCRYLQNEYHWSVTIGQGIITFLVIFNFFLATYMDPGIVKKANSDEEFNLDDGFDAPFVKTVQINGITVQMKWCVPCRLYQPPRCSHCRVCNNCVNTFDHHSPWVNNCIGRRNYRPFFFFLICLSIQMVFTFLWCIVFILDHKETLHQLDSIVTLVLLALTAVLFLPIIGLTVYYLILVARGLTTNEQVTGVFRENYKNYNPYSKGGCWANYWYTLCGLRCQSKCATKKNCMNYICII